MATIEERAKLLSDMYEATYNEFGHGYKKGLYDGYIIGAHQQKKIDIYRAYSWLVHNLDDDRAFVVWRDFKKFMMEE